MNQLWAAVMVAIKLGYLLIQTSTRQGLEKEYTQL
jgi:hypothetical protein